MESAMFHVLNAQGRSIARFRTYQSAAEYSRGRLWIEFRV